MATLTPPSTDTAAAACAPLSTEAEEPALLPASLACLGELHARLVEIKARLKDPGENPEHLAQDIERLECDLRRRLPRYVRHGAPVLELWHHFVAWDRENPEYVPGEEAPLWILREVVRHIGYEDSTRPAPRLREPAPRLDTLGPRVRHVLLHHYGLGWRLNDAGDLREGVDMDLSQLADQLVGSADPSTEAMVWLHLAAEAQIDAAVALQWQPGTALTVGQLRRLRLTVADELRHAVRASSGDQRNALIAQARFGCWAFVASTLGMGMEVVRRIVEPVPGTEFVPLEAVVDAYMAGSTPLDRATRSAGAFLWDGLFGSSEDPLPSERTSAEIRMLTEGCWTLMDTVLGWIEEDEQALLEEDRDELSKRDALERLRVLRPVRETHLRALAETTVAHHLVEADLDGIEDEAEAEARVRAAASATTASAMGWVSRELRDCERVRAQLSSRIPWAADGQAKVGLRLWRLERRQEMGSDPTGE